MKMRTTAWLIGICLIVLIGCDRPSVSRPVAAVVPVAPAKAARVAPLAAIAPVTAKPSPQLDPAAHEPQAAPAHSDPLKSPGPDYAWIRPCLKSDGTEIAGFWKQLARMPKSKPVPREVVARPSATTAPLVVQDSQPSRPGFTWVDAHTRKDGVKVKGFWRKLPSK